jgi:hypothetical protein
MSDLPGRLEIVTGAGTPTAPFLAAWAGAGAVSSLPASTAVVDRDGRPTGEFLALFRTAFPASRLGARDVIAQARRPTRRFIAVWSAATA